MPLTVNVDHFEAIIREVGKDGGQTSIKEDFNTQRQKLRYESRYFTADATVTCTNTDQTPWYVGFVQYCTAVRNEAHYTNHSTRWDSATPVCDCCGVHPWYGTGSPRNAGALGQAGTGRVEIPAAASNQQFFVSMNDNLGSNVPWYDPVPFGLTGATFPATNPYPEDLTHFYRDQSFTAYLAAIPKAGGQWQLYRAAIWRLRLSVTFDKSKPLGQRAKPNDRRASTSLPRPTGANEQLPVCLTAVICPGTMNQTQQFNGYTKTFGALVGQLSTNY